jgi:hypothetical protein
MKRPDEERMAELKREMEAHTSPSMTRCSPTATTCSATGSPPPTAPPSRSSSTPSS